MIQISKEHIKFAQSAALLFDGNIQAETLTSNDEDLIALRYGMDRDCVAIYELGKPIANFVQHVSSKTRHPRESVEKFASEMEKQLAANEHKGGWNNAKSDWLRYELDKNRQKLDECETDEEFFRRCANIANFAMMLAENKSKVYLVDPEDRR